MRISTAEKLQRLISIVSWIHAHDGPTLDEVCRRFGIGRDDLVRQLAMANMVGAESEEFGDMPIAVHYEGDRVFVFLMDFHRPLRLTPEQGLALVAAGAGLREIEGAAADDPLARALAKVAEVLGIDPAESVDVDLGDVDTAVLETLRTAVTEHRQVDLDYWSAGRDHRTHRTVEPWRVFNEAGAWYLQARCHLAEGERVFRVDRIRGLVALDERFRPPSKLGQPVAYQAGADDPRVVLELDPSARWVVSTYPVERVEELGDGRLRVTMPAGAPAFLARLLLRLGPRARVAEADDRSGATTLAIDAATRILRRYHRG